MESVDQLSLTYCKTAQTILNNEILTKDSENFMFQIKRCVTACLIRSNKNPRVNILHSNECEF